MYTSVYFDTHLNADYVDKKWNVEYILVQGKTSESGIITKRSITFSIVSGSNYEMACNQLLKQSVDELSKCGFDLFNLSESEFYSLKKRIENGETKDNQIAKN